MIGHSRRPDAPGAAPGEIPFGKNIANMHGFLNREAGGHWQSPPRPGEKKHRASQKKDCFPKSGGHIFTPFSEES